MKLQVGDIIQVHGWVMLAKLEDGHKYKVSRIKKVNGAFSEDAYFFTKARGKKEVVGHTVSNIDMWIGNENNLNRIEVLS